MTCKTKKAEHERSRAAFEQAFPVMDFARVHIKGGTRYADLGTYQLWRGWKASWLFIKENGTNP